MLNIRVELQGAEACKRILSEYPKSCKTAFRNAIVSAARATKAEINRQIKARYEISPANLKSVMTVKTVSPKASSGDGESGGLIVTGPRIPIMKFNVQPTGVVSQAGLPVNRRAIVSTVVVKGQQIAGKPNRFILRTKSGHINIFHRGGSSKVGAALSDSLPVDQEFRPAIPQLIASRHIRPAIEKKMSETFQTELVRQTQLQLKLLHEKK